MFDTTRKKGHIIFLNGILPFFQRCLFSKTSQVLKNCSHKLHSSCQKSLWTPLNCFLRLVTLDKTRKSGPNVFFIVKVYFLNSLFLPTSWVLKNWSYYSQSNCQKTLWTPIECFLMPILLDNSRRNVQFVFSSEKIAFFFSKNCVFNNFASFTDMIS